LTQTIKTRSFNKVEIQALEIKRRRFAGGVTRVEEGQWLQREKYDSHQASRRHEAGNLRVP
jgi:hypothetical protein